jgi:hypothetical protein
VPFVWRGFLSSFLNNAHRYRLRGAEALRIKLLQVRQTNPGASIFVISHSHGGNVSLYAMRDEAVAQSVTGIICMATPFFVVRPDDGFQGSVEDWLGFLRGIFMFGGAMMVPLAVVVSVVWLALQVLPHVNQYVQTVISPLFTIAGLAWALAANYLLIYLFPLAENVVRHLAREGQRTSEQSLRAILPPYKPVLCLLASGDEFRTLFGICSNVMKAIKHRYVSVGLFVIGVVVICACQWWIVRSVRGIWQESLHSGDITAPVVVIGGVFASFTLLVALVALSLTSFRTLADRLLTRLRTLLYGWETFPEMLFSNIDATPLPYGHGDICSEDLHPERLHSAKPYTMEGKSWLHHCEIYLNKGALEDIITWVKATTASEELKCEDCVALGARKISKTDQPPTVELRLISEFGPRTSRHNI